MRSKLPNSVLRRVWALSDIDQDGMLDRDEFAVAMFLIDHKLDGNDIPDTLPPKLIPPSKAALFRRNPTRSVPPGDGPVEESWGGATSGYGGGGGGVNSSYSGGATAGVGGRGSGGRSYRGQPPDEYDSGGSGQNYRGRSMEEEEDEQGLSSFVDRRH